MEKWSCYSIRSERQSQNPGTGKDFKGHLIQHGISFIELSDVDMNIVKSFPTTGIFTFPKKLVFIRRQQKTISPHIKPKSSPYKPSFQDVTRLSLQICLIHL